MRSSGDDNRRQCTLRFLRDGDWGGRAWRRSGLGHRDWRNGRLDALGDGHRGGTNCNRVAEDDSGRVASSRNLEVVTVERLSGGVRVHLKEVFV